MVIDMTVGVQRFRPEKVLHRLPGQFLEVRPFDKYLVASSSFPSP